VTETCKSNYPTHCGEQSRAAEGKIPRCLLWGFIPVITGVSSFGKLMTI
jgi:hypothetical protein